jgi:hypothetical protein
MAEPASMDNNQQQVKKKKKKKEKEKFFEPMIKWRDSDAKFLLYKDIMEGTVPLEALDENGESTMPLLDIYVMHPELVEYDYSKLSSQLRGLRTTIATLMDREEEDQQDFAAYVSNHPASSFLHHGYIEYQGSEAQELLLQDVEDKLHKTMGKKALWMFRSEYHLNFPLRVFRDKIYQEIRTAKYLHTCKVQGKLHQAS